MLSGDGALVGRLWLFGAIPPLPISGWWWLEPGGQMVWDFTTAVEEAGDVLTFHLRLPFHANHGRPQTFASSSDDDRWILRRV